MPNVPPFATFLQVFSLTMSTASYTNLLVIAQGWVFASHHTITGCLLCAHPAPTKHHSAYHRLFSAAPWSLDEVGLLLFLTVLSLLRTVSGGLSGTIFLCVDDSLARKRGKTMYGTGMHYDPLQSSPGHTVVSRGHSWVVLGVLVRCSFLPFLHDRTFCLPVLFRLYRNKVTCQQKGGNAYKKRWELALEILTLLCERFSELSFHLVTDSGYGGQDLLNALPRNCDLTSRLGPNARLYEAPPQREPGKPGRPRKRGDKLPTPKEMLQKPGPKRVLTIRGQRINASVRQAVGRLYDVPERPVRVAAVHFETMERPLQAFFSTCVDANAVQILAWYASRWAIEMTFQEAKQHLGFEEPQGWTRNAVLRTAPFALLLYTLIVLWFVHGGHRFYAPPERSWYTTKTRACFVDILTALRQALLLERVFSLHLQKHAREKTLATLTHLVYGAM